MEKRLAVYAGTFDPLTNGHLWVITQGSKIFDEIIVAIGINPEKNCMFSVEERLDMLRESTKHLKNVRADAYPYQLLVKYVRSVGAKFIIRGIRDEKDYKEERKWRNINGDLDPEINTIFLIPPRELEEISSSLVKGLVAYDGWEEAAKIYVPEPVLEKLKEKRNAKTT